MCRWMGSRFHYWIDYNGVAFSIKFLEHVEWGHKEGVRKKRPRKVLSRIKFVKYIMGSSYLLKLTIPSPLRLFQNKQVYNQKAKVRK